MSQPAKAQEPSMEEILASIRRIIADDDGKPAAAKPAPAPAPASPPPRPAAMPPRNAGPLPPPPRPVPAPPPPAPPVMDQLGVDAMMASEHEEEPESPPEDVLDLTEQMEAPPDAEVPSFQTIDGQSDVVFTEMPPAPDPPLPRPQPAPSAAERSIMSASTSAAVDSAFSALAHTVLVQNARTLEDLVREMLRPMLKSWLDDNLPGMVERIIKAEIERVSRGRG